MTCWSRGPPSSPRRAVAIAKLLRLQGLPRLLPAMADRPPRRPRLKRCNAGLLEAHRDVLERAVGLGGAATRPPAAAPLYAAVQPLISDHPLSPAMAAAFPPWPPASSSSAFSFSPALPDSHSHGGGEPVERFLDTLPGLRETSSSSGTAAMDAELREASSSRRPRAPKYIVSDSGEVMLNPWRRSLSGGLAMEETALPSLPALSSGLGAPTFLEVSMNLPPPQQQQQQQQEESPFSMWAATCLQMTGQWEEEALSAMAALPEQSGRGLTLGQMAEVALAERAVAGGIAAGSGAVEVPEIGLTSAMAPLGLTPATAPLGLTPPTAPLGLTSATVPVGPSSVTAPLGLTSATVPQAAAVASRPASPAVSAARGEAMAAVEKKGGGGEGKSGGRSRRRKGKKRRTREELWAFWEEYHGKKARSSEPDDDDD